MTIRSSEPVRAAPLSDESLRDVEGSYRTSYASLNVRIKAHEANNFGKPLALALSVLPTADKIRELFKTDHQGVSEVVSRRQLALRLARIRKVICDDLHGKMKGDDGMFDRTEKEVACNAIEIVFNETILALQSRRIAVAQYKQRQRLRSLHHPFP